MSDPTPAFVRVFETINVAVVAVAKSLLEAERIDYFTKNEGLQGSIGYGAVTGTIEFWVRADDAETAGRLLEDLRP
jgi:putative signal transducing protein